MDFIPALIGFFVFLIPPVVVLGLPKYNAVMALIYLMIAFLYAAFFCLYGMMRMGRKPQKYVIDQDDKGIIHGHTLDLADQKVSYV